MDEVEDVEREGSENENENGEEGGKEPVNEYVKKDYFARPYVSPYPTENDVKALTVKNNR